MSRVARSLLFVPGNRPDRFDKALASGAHLMVIDLEDAVAADAKSRARDDAGAWLAPDRSVCVRINSADTEWFEDDLEMVRGLPAVSVMLPKADAGSLACAADALPGRTLVALLETVQGYMELREMTAVPGLQRIAFGSIDFGLDSGIADEDDAMTAIRTQIVLESRFAGLQAPLDGVSVNFKDEAVLQVDVRRGQLLGFGGKLCIHPLQVPVVNAAYRPDQESIAWARRIVAADEVAGGGATTVDGTMVDRPVVERARRILEDVEP